MPILGALGGTASIGKGDIGEGHPDGGVGEGLEKTCSLGRVGCNLDDDERSRAVDAKRGLVAEAYSGVVDEVAVWDKSGQDAIRLKGMHEASHVQVSV